MGCATPFKPGLSLSILRYVSEYKPWLDIMNEDYPDLVSSVIAPELQCIAIYCNILQSCPLREAPKRQEICLQSSRSYDQLCEIQFLAGIVNIKNEAGEALVTGSRHVRERSSDPCYQGLYSHCFPTNSLKFTCPAVFSLLIWTKPWLNLGRLSTPLPSL